MISNVLDENGKLPNSIKPINYEIIINPNMTDFTFKGKVSIDVLMIDTAYDYIGLHSKNLQIINVKIANKFVDFKLDATNELIVIKIDKPNQPNQPNQLKIEINYTGEINDNLKGFYRSKYIATNNNVKTEEWILSTQFESTDARQAFPCFDEPNFKATFDIAIIHDSNYIALSNEDVKSKTKKDNKTITIFNKTPKMSTYLVAFVVGKLGYVEGFNKTNKRIRVYATDFQNQNLNKLIWAKEVSIKCLDWFENYFEIPYQMSKMDMIAIPDFKSGAMENWGLITFRPETLLCDNSDSIDTKINVVMTIGHEISHQWFGNYVTLDYWNYLWLNESMATYYGWLVCDELYPQWNVWDIYMKNEFLTALELDSLESSHQIEFDLSAIKNPKNIDQFFDAISYSKGSCLIRGLVNKIGSNVFRKGMQNYMKKYAWSNTKSEDLWNCFDQIITADQFDLDNINKFMTSWIKTTGYPVVKLDCDNMTLTQFRYLKSGPTKNTNNVDDVIDVDAEDDGIQLWNIPILIEISNYGQIDYVMSKKSEKLNLEIKKRQMDFVINPHRYGFYRVMYHMKNFSVDNLPFEINSLEHSVLANILDDSFALAFGGYQNLEIPMQIIKKINLEKVTNYNLWRTILSNIIYIEKILDQIVSRNKYYEKYYWENKSKWNNFIKNYIGSFVKKKLQKIKINAQSDEPANNEYLRSIFVNFLNIVNDEEIINYSKQQFNEGKYKLILNTFVKNCSDNEFEKVIDLLFKKNNPHIKNKIFESMEHINSKNKADLVVLEILNKKIRNHNIPKILYHLSNNKYGNKIIWNHVKSKWNQCDIFNENSSNVVGIIKSIGSGINTSNDLDEFKILFEKNPEGTQMIINQTIEKIKNKINCTQIILKFIEQI